MAVGELSDREDRPAYVRFERRAVEDKQASLKEGRSVSKDMDFALVTPPYSRDCVVQKVDAWLSNVEQNVRNGRVPQEWLDQWRKAYEHWKNGQEIPLNGTSIKNWGVISPAQCKNLIAVGILTIEDLAAVNDQGLRRIGMGGVELKQKAKAWLQATKDHGPLVMENTALKTEIEQLKGTIESLQNQIKILSQPKLQVVNNNEPADLGISFEDIDPEPKRDIHAEYEQKFGKKPHHLMKDETILRKLEE